MAPPTFNWDAPWALIAVLIAVLFVGIVFAARYFSVEDRRGKYVLLVGLPGAGKSALFFKMRDGRGTKTFMSMKENVGSFRFRGESSQQPQVHMVDIPGHERLRKEILEKYARNCRAVVFMIDSAAFAKNSKDVAACLYSALANGPIRRGCIPFYVLCNKQDIITATGAESTRITLEREIDNLRKTRAVSSHLGEEEVFLGTPGVPFAFSQLPHRVTFEPGAIENIESVAVWVRDIVNIDNHNTLPNWMRPLAE